MRKRVWVVVSVLCVAVAFSRIAQAAQPGDHFKALGPDKTQGKANSLFFPNDFEAAVASHPDPNALTFFSLCRRALSPRHRCFHPSPRSMSTPS